MPKTHDPDSLHKIVPIGAKPHLEQFTVRLEPEVLDSCRQVASELGVSLSMAIRFVLRQRMPVGSSMPQDDGLHNQLVARSILVLPEGRNWDVFGTIRFPRPRKRKRIPLPNVLSRPTDFSGRLVLPTSHPPRKPLSAIRSLPTSPIRKAHRETMRPWHEWFNVVVNRVVCGRDFYRRSANDSVWWAAFLEFDPETGYPHWHWMLSLPEHHGLKTLTDQQFDESLEEALTQKMAKWFPEVEVWLEATACESRMMEYATKDFSGHSECVLDYVRGRPDATRKPRVAA